MIQLLSIGSDKNIQGYIHTRKGLLGEKRDATSLVLEDIFLKFKVKA
jgi:hypothetical protein